MRRARYFGGYLEGPDGSQVRIERQEYPYDVGIWENMKQGMGGTGNVSQINLIFSSDSPVNSRISEILATFYANRYN